MKRDRRFVAWQPVLTDHQAFTLEALAQLSGRQVLVYVMRLEDAVRRAQGWADTQVTTIERHLLPDRHTLRHCYQRLREHRHDIHLFGSPFEQPKMMLVLLMAALVRVDFYLISEPYSPRTEGYFDDEASVGQRLKASLRPLVYRCYGLLIGRRVRGVFTISSLAADQYRRSGVAAAKLFPFGYFVPRIEPAPDAGADRNAQASGLRLVFVGALIRRKGLDLLMAAVGRLVAEDQPIWLDVYGPGDPGAYAFDTQHIRHRGVIPFGQAPAVIAGYGLLAVPSRYDGWGVVVNEALSAHVPVLCSDQVGARALVETFGAGAVFAADDADALYDALKALLRDPNRLARMREATLDAARAIEPAVAASYLLAVIEAEPQARTAIASPWYRDAGAGHA